MKILIKNGTVINPATDVLDVLDVLIEDDKIIKIDKNIESDAEKVIDAKDCWVTPGFIDVHVHLREPGFEYKETIKTGSMSAVKGGFTTICCMPNTSPVIDSEILVEYVNLKAHREAVCNVLPIGAITKGMIGDELSEIGKMHKAGICAISEDGKSVMNAGILKTAMNYAKMFNLPVLSHCEDKSLAGGSMNAGENSQILGIKGISNESEAVIVARDVLLANATGAKLHICHVSTTESVRIIKDARERGENVTAEVCPHHFSLSDDAVLKMGYDGNTKMSPPLRSNADVLELKKALKDDTLSIIATDHAPHSVDEKNCEYDKVMFGIVGLETALPLSITNLVNEDWLTPSKLIEKLTINPAKLINIDKGDISVGKIADITIIDPNAKYTVDVSKFASKSKNSPFDGHEVCGKVLHTIVAGEIVVFDCELTK